MSALMRLSWPIAFVVGCGRIAFDPIGGSAPGDGLAKDTGSGSAGTCNGTVTGCFSTSLSLSNASSGNAGNDTRMFADDSQGPCGGAGGGDFGVHFLVLQAGTYQFSVSAAFDTVLYAISGTTCAGASLGCVDTPGASGEVLTLALAQSQELTVVADSSGACGPVTVSFQGL